MEPGSIICRAAVHPKYINMEIFDNSALFYFVAVKDLGARVSSVTSLEICGNEDAVHVQGRTVAQRSNEREEVRITADSDYTPREFHYLGFYNLKSSQVSEIASDFHEIELNWRPEDGSNAHFQIEIYERQKPPTKAEGRSDRNAIITLLSDLLSGPTLCPNGKTDEKLLELQVSSLATRIPRE